MAKCCKILQKHNVSNFYPDVWRTYTHGMRGLLECRAIARWGFQRGLVRNWALQPNPNMLFAKENLATFPMFTICFSRQHIRRQRTCSLESSGLHSFGDTSFAVHIILSRCWVGYRNDTRWFCEQEYRSFDAKPALVGSQDLSHCSTAENNRKVCIGWDLIDHQIVTARQFSEKKKFHPIDNQRSTVIFYSIQRGCRRLSDYGFATFYFAR